MRYCPICGGSLKKHLLVYPEIPVFDNVLYETEHEAEKALCGTQDLAICIQCGFVCNCEFEPEKVNYKEGYHAERSVSPYFCKHMYDVAEWIHSKVSLTNKSLLEVASGNGEFLNVLTKFKPQTCVGVDPSADTSMDGSIVLEQALFDESYLERHPIADVLINRHMIEHIQNPLQMLSLFYRAISESGVLYLETPRLDWILQNHVFYDFPYEHCSYYSDEFIKRLLEAAGFAVIGSRNTYNGQYYSILARKTHEALPLRTVSKEDRQRIEKSFTELHAAKQYAYERFCMVAGNNWLWGASAKGVMCCNLIGGSIAGCIDKNPFKQGRFISRTATAVISPAEIPFHEIDQIYVENDVYLNEIQEELNSIAPNIKLLSLNTFIEIDGQKN